MRYFTMFKQFTFVYTISCCFQYQGIFRMRFSKKHMRISTAEKKLLFILSYYVVFGIVILIYFSLSSNDEDIFLDAAETYFICEASGNASSCSRSEFEQYTHPILATATYLLMGLIPVFILIFTVNWSQTSARIGRLCHHQKNCQCRSSHKNNNNTCAESSVQ